MRLPLSAWSTAELDHAYDTLGAACSVVRSDGRYHLAAMMLAMRAEVNQILIERSTASAVEKTRQLTLCRPGAYGESVDDDGSAA